MDGGSVTLAGTQGEDTEVVYMYFYDFKPGEKVTFEGSTITLEIQDLSHRLPIGERTLIIIDLEVQGSCCFWIPSRN